MAIKTKIETYKNEINDFKKELLGRLHYLAQSSDNILIKKFYYFSDKLTFTTFVNKVNKDDRSSMETLVFENKDVITLFFKSEIYYAQHNHHSEGAYFCQLKDDTLYIPQKIYDIKLRKNYQFLKDIKFFFKNEYKNISIKNVQIVNDDSFFFKNLNILPYQYKLYAGEISITTLLQDDLYKILGEREFPVLHKDDKINEIYAKLDKMETNDLVRIENYDNINIPDCIKLVYYETYGFIEQDIMIATTKDSDIEFFKVSNYKFQKFGSSLETRYFTSKTELENVLEEMAISKIEYMENKFLPSKQIENKRQFLQLMSEIYDRRTELTSDLYNLFNTEINEALQELNAIVVKNKNENVI